jgi:hypothetical protein
MRPRRHSRPRIWQEKETALVRSSLPLHVDFVGILPREASIYVADLRRIAELLREIRRQFIAVLSGVAAQRCGGLAACGAHAAAGGAIHITMQICGGG